MSGNRATTAAFVRLKNLHAGACQHWNGSPTPPKIINENAAVMMKAMVVGPYTTVRERLPCVIDRALSYGAFVV